MEQNRQELWGSDRRGNMHSGTTQKEKKEKAEEIYEIIMVENYPKLTDPFLCNDFDI